MVRSFLLLLLIFPFSLIAIAQITMDDIPLSWNDFSRRMEVYQNRTAQIQTSIEGKILYRNVGTKRIYYILSKCYINRNGTVVKSGFIEKAGMANKLKALQHEKGHLIISFIHHEKFREVLRRHSFRGPTKREIDSLLKETITEVEKLNKLYDRETNHGLNDYQQELWAQKLMDSLDQVCGGNKDFLSQMETVIKVGPGIKITDPVSIDYSRISPVFDYQVSPFYQGDTTFLGDGKYRLYKDEPFEGGRDSILCIEGVDFTKDFELEIMVSIPKTASRYKHGARLFWGTNDSSGGNSMSILPTVLILNYCMGGDHKKDYRKNIYLRKRLKEDVTRISVRKIADQYSFFVNDYFEKSLPYVPLPGNGIAVGTVLNGYEIKSLRLFYLSD